MRERLPSSPSRLIGRDRELAELRAILGEGARLITLTGAGGSGKTALGLALAQSIAEDFASSAFIDLSGLRDPSLVPQAIATGVMAPRGAEPTFDSIVGHIGLQPTLILLDNFEQLLPEAAVVSDLLSACPALVILTTSRAPMELRWERVYQVGPLALPDEATTAPAQLRSFASIALFVERARAVKPLFTLDKTNGQAVARIVRRLDGLPLAIELAAARLRVLSVADLAARVDRALDLLTQGDADRPPRQRTIRATIDWSLALLTDSQRRLLRRLGIFDGGAMLDAVDAVCAEPGEPTPLLDDLEDLVQAGVVMTTEWRGETRVRLPATVRERANELLDESGERAAIADRHAREFSRLCWEIGDMTAEALWFARTELEDGNIRAALRHSLGEAGTDREPGMRIVYAMGGPWSARGSLAEMKRWVDLAIAVGRSTPQWSLVCCQSGLVARDAGDLERAESYFKTALEIHNEMRLPERIIHQTEGLGRVARDRGQEDIAFAYYDEVMRLADQLGLSAAGRAVREGQYAFVSYWFGRAAQARTHAERGLALARESKSGQVLAILLVIVADLARDRGDLAEASRLLDEAWSVASAIGHRVLQRDVSTSRIRLACVLNEPARAVESARQSLPIAREVGDRNIRTAAWIDALAFAALAMAQHDAAEHLFSFADALRSSVGIVVAPVDVRERERARALARAALGQRANVSAADMSIGALFEFAERVFAPPQTPSIALSRREREVASLVARGLSNRAIAERLVLGERTVETHVERLLRKLEVRSRHDVADRAQELALPL